MSSLGFFVARRTVRQITLSAAICLGLSAMSSNGSAQSGGGGGGGGAAGAGAAGAASGQGASGSAPGGHGGAGCRRPRSSPWNPWSQRRAERNAQRIAGIRCRVCSRLGPSQTATGQAGCAHVAAGRRARPRRNPTLLAADANLRSVRAQELQAAVRANPYLGVTGADTTYSADVNNPYAYTVQFSRLFERGNKRTYRVEDARATTAQTAGQLQDTIRQTILQVRTAFTHMLFAKQALELSKAQLADFRHEVEIANDRYKAGDLGKLDFERLDLQLGSFESDAANDQVALQQASDQLQTLIGVGEPKSSFDIAGDIIPPDVKETREQLIQQALVGRPDLAAAGFGVTAAQAAYRLAVSNGTSDPTIEVEYDRSGHENSFGFNVNFPLRIFDKNQGNKETTRLSIDAAQLTLAATRNQVSSDVDQAWVAYVQTKALSDRFGSHYLDEAADVLSIARFAFDHGGIALIDYLDSLRDARSSTSNALERLPADLDCPFISSAKSSATVDSIP